MEGKVALVMGAAELLAREGASVVLTDVRDGEGQAAAEVLGERVAYRRLDVRDEDGWEDAGAFAEERFGQLDVLVSNAGVTGFEEDLGSQDPEHASLAGWRAVHASNLDGCFSGASTLSGP
jgi:NAD(P)-dependent dehydrogenase (short-subunit alcohol dehydrogenase family)